MVQALSSQIFIVGGQGLVIHRPEPMERYIPIAPGIEVSVEVHPGQDWNSEGSVYNRQGRIDGFLKKGLWLDRYF